MTHTSNPSTQALRQENCHEFNVSLWKYWVSGRDELLSETVSQAEKEMGISHTMVIKLWLCEIVPKMLTVLDTIQGHGETGCA